MKRIALITIGLFLFSAISNATIAGISAGDDCEKIRVKRILWNSKDKHFVLHLSLPRFAFNTANQARFSISAKIIVVAKGESCEKNVKKYTPKLEKFTTVNPEKCHPAKLNVSWDGLSRQFFGSVFVTAKLKLLDPGGRTVAEGGREQKVKIRGQKK